MSKDNERIDVLLVKKGLFESREKAARNILAGLVFVNNQRVDKCGEKVDINADIVVKGDAIPYVSRGGLKLEKAINDFKLNLQGKTTIDVGASTGGFTDCMLKNGTEKVFAIDVGYGQFAWNLRIDKRVVCMERTNIRYVKPSDLGTIADFASIDVSFISLKLVLPVVKDLIKPDGEIISLIKPQFEAGREKVGKKGVVRDAEVHKEVIENVIEFALSNGLSLMGLTYSPIKGPEGNIEYLSYFINHEPESTEVDKNQISDIVNKSHMILKIQ